MWSLKSLLLAVAVRLSFGKIVPIIYEDFEICVKPEERAGKFDFSELHYIAESDTVVYVNGSWNIMEEVKSPWKTEMYTERFIRGQWVGEAFYKKIDDFCAVIQEPLQPWYKVTRKFKPKNCPFPAGVSIFS